MIFANAQAVSDMEEQFADGTSAIFSMRGVSYMDISGAQGFLELIEVLKKKDVQVLICGASTAVATMMERSGIKETVGEENFYWSVEHALTGEKRA